MKTPQQIKNEVKKGDKGHYEKFCSECGNGLIPRINSNPDDDRDNLYYCEKCNRYYECNDESYTEHIEAVKRFRGIR